VGRTQAEDLTASGYESNTFEGQTCARATSTSPGNVRGAFGGGSGTYDVTVRHFDEDDGQATLTLRVNGVAVESRTLNVDDHTWKSWVVRGVTLETGDEVRVEGARQAGEHARVDYLEIGGS
jgi:hypothetical protein